MALPAVQGKTREGRHSLPGRAGRLRSRGEEDRRQGELDARRRVSFVLGRARSRWQRRRGPPAAGWPRCALCSRSRGQEMFEKAHIDALFSELERQWRGGPGGEARSKGEKWGPREVLCHLVWWHQATVEGMESVLSGGKPYRFYASIDEMNARAVGRLAGQDIAQLAELVRQLQARLVRAV